MKAKMVPPGFPLCACGCASWKTVNKGKLYQCRVCFKLRVTKEEWNGTEAIGNPSGGEVQKKV